MFWALMPKYGNLSPDPPKIDDFEKLLFFLEAPYQYASNEPWTTIIPSFLAKWQPNVHENHVLAHCGGGIEKYFNLFLIL